MVPILFAPSATSFTTNGLGRLADTNKCTVIEELNGQYELELTYPKEGRLFSSIGYSSIIVAKPFQNGKLQPFRVYKISKPMKNLVTAYARHITYQLNFIPCSPFSGQTAKQVMQNIPTATAEYCPFTFTTTIDNTKQSVSPNLFGLETVESGIINAYLDGTGRLIEEENALSVWIKCEKSKRYSLSKMTGQCFAAGSMTQIPSEGQLVANYVSHPTDRKFEYTTTSDAEYLVMFVYRQSLDGAAAYVGIYNSISIRAIGTYTWMLYEPKTVRSFLMENEDSIQNIYGGEYEWDNYNVILHENRGSNKGVKIRYGKNLIDLTQEENIENTITGIYPIWKSDGTVVELPEKVVHASNASNFPFYRTVIQDLTSEFDQMPTEEELREAATVFIQNEGIGIPEVSLEVNFVNLSETMEYSGVGGLQSVNLGDTVTVEFPDLGVSAEQKVTKTEYDVLNERYTKVTIGTVKDSLTNLLEDQMNDISEKVTAEQAQNSIDRATGVMNAGRRGHVIIGRNDDGFANEIYFLDNANIALAKNVLRINVNGIGFSSNGLRGPYAQAWTLDGHLTLGGVNNANGTLEILNSSGQVIGRWDNNGINSMSGTIRGTSFHSSNDEFYVEENGEDGVEVGWSGWDVWNRSMQSQTLGWDSNNHVNPASGTSAAAAMNGGPNSDYGDSGDDGYGGTAGFKALWLDDDWFEGGSSNWSYTSYGRSNSHLWDVAEVLQWLDSRVTYLENHQGGGGGGGDGSSCGEGDGSSCGGGTDGTSCGEGDVSPCNDGYSCGDTDGLDCHEEDGGCCGSEGYGNCCGGEGDGNCCGGEDGPGC